MAPPFAQTLFVELIRFQPGQPQTAATITPTPRSISSHHQSPRSLAPHPHPHSGPPHHEHYPHLRSPPMLHRNGEVLAHSPGSQIIPPPPWSRWTTVVIPAPPHPSESLQSTPQLSSRKRKHEDIPTPEDISRVHSSASSGPPPKRRPVPSIPLSPPCEPMRPVQTLSPSLAMIVSPVNQTVITSPRTPYIPPLRSGTSGSPSMPPGGPNRS